MMLFKLDIVVHETRWKLEGEAGLHYLKHRNYTGEKVSQYEDTLLGVVELD